MDRVGGEGFGLGAVAEGVGVELLAFGFPTDELRLVSRLESLGGDFAQSVLPLDATLEESLQWSA